MIRVAIGVLFACLAPVLPVAARQVDPGSLVRPALLDEALAASRHLPGSSHLVVIDYSKHSSEDRVYVINRESGSVSAFRASHGRGSDPDHDGYLDRFSSELGSKASPEGLFRLAEQYTGVHGRAARLDGLDADNRTARARAIVIHAADYAEPEFLKQHGKLGRSNGCIVFSKADLERFLADVPEGALIFAGR